MTTTGPVDVHVDTGELGRLRSELEALSQELDIVYSAIDYPDEAFGGAEVHGAVGEFESSWRSTRSALSEGLMAAAHLVATAIEAYEQAEGMLKAASEAVT